MNSIEINNIHKNVIYIPPMYDATFNAIYDATWSEIMDATCPPILNIMWRTTFDATDGYLYDI